MRERYDYPANRGPLDGKEYVKRRPDGFSSCAGCLFLVLWIGLAIGGAICLVVLVLKGGMLP